MCLHSDVLKCEVAGAFLQVKSTDEEGLSPPNLLVIHEDPERGYGSERHYIPYVPQIVKQIDNDYQELLIKPPKGLLQLGRERAALRFVEPLLKVQTAEATHGAAYKMDAGYHKSFESQRNIDSRYNLRAPR